MQQQPSSELILKNLPQTIRKPVELFKKTKKISQFKPKDWMAFDNSLLTLCYFLGIDPAPEVEKREVICTFLKNMYHDISREELEYAFNLALSEKLDLTSDQTKHFNNLSGPYIATILNAYRRYRNKQLAIYEKQVAVLLPQRTELSEYEIKKIMLQALFDIYKQYKQDGDFYDMNGSCFDYFVRNKVFSSPTEDELEQARLKAVEQLRGELLDRKRKETAIKALETAVQIKEVIEQSVNSPQVIVRTKKILLFDIFSTLEQNSEELLEFEKLISLK